MASQEKDFTSMWDIMSPEDDKVMMEKFVEESNKVISRWSLGNASLVEKDAATSFLVQLGVVQITIQSDSQRIDSQKKVCFQFGQELHSKTEAECGIDKQVETKDAIPISRNSVREATLSQDQDTKAQHQAHIDGDEEEEDDYYPVGITEPDDESDDDKMQIPDKTPEVTCQQPRKEHPCPDCHVILNSTWDLDLHRLRDCVKKPLKPIQYVYECDKCLKSFIIMLSLVNHLRKVHKMTPAEVADKIAEIKDARRLKSCKGSKRSSFQISTKQLWFKNKTKQYSQRKSCNTPVLKRTRKDAQRHTCKSSDKYSHLLSKTPRIKLQPLPDAWMKVLENEAIDVNKFVLNSPVQTAAVSTIEALKPVCTPDEYQDPNCEAGSEVDEDEPLVTDAGREASANLPEQQAVEEDIGISSGLNSNEISDQGYADVEQVLEKHREYPMPQRGPEAAKEDTEGESSATMPMSQNSEDEGEESGSNIEVLKTAEHQDPGCTSRQMEEDNQDASTDPHMEKERQQADPGDGTCEASELTEHKNLHDIAYKRQEVNSLGSVSVQFGQELHSKAEAECDSAKQVETKDAMPISRNSVREATLSQDQDNKAQHQVQINDDGNEEDDDYYPVGITEPDDESDNAKMQISDKTPVVTHVEAEMHKNEKENYCKTCDKEYASKYLYDIHMKLHDNESDPLRCNICGKTFASRSSVGAHVLIVHNKEVKFTCAVCGEKFDTISKGKIHMQSHQRERAFQCKECGKGFFRKHELKQHIQRVHLEADRCICDICGSSLKTRRNLELHYVTAHTDVYKYLCDFCGKKFQRKTYLNIHLKIHSNDPKIQSDNPKTFSHRCELCSKGFRQKNALNVHMNWHYNIRSHTCTVCGKSFLTKGNRDKHMYTHGKKKPHECWICSCGFVDRPALRKHLLSAHNVTSEMLVTKGLGKRRGVRGSCTKGSESDVTVHKPPVRPPSTSASGSDYSNGDTSRCGETAHQESFISSSVAQVSETTDGQDVRDQALQVVNT